jgi:hypothetical protein
VEKKNPQQLKELKNRCKRRDYDAIVELLCYHISEGTEITVNCVTDHRYHQGKVKALRDFLEDIVLKVK